MSHFTVLVVGDVDSQLEIFSENMEVKPYKETLSAEDQNRMLEYYREKYDRPDLTKEEVCEYGPSWNGGQDWGVDEDGNIYYMCTYNPDSKWDWYEVGGRWAGSLVVKEEFRGKYAAPSVSLGWSEEENKSISDGLHTDSCLKKHLDIEATREGGFKSAFAVLKDREWYERGHMGWFTCVSDENPDWEKIQAELFDSIGDDEWITVVDCHI